MVPDWKRLIRSKRNVEHWKVNGFGFGLNPRRRFQYISNPILILLMKKNHKKNDDFHFRKPESIDLSQCKKRKNSRVFCFTFCPKKEKLSYQERPCHVYCRIIITISSLVVIHNWCFWPKKFNQNGRTKLLTKCYLKNLQKNNPNIHKGWSLISKYIIYYR